MMDAKKPKVVDIKHYKEMKASTEGHVITLEEAVGEAFEGLHDLAMVCKMQSDQIERLHGHMKVQDEVINSLLELNTQQSDVTHFLDQKMNLICIQLQLQGVGVGSAGNMRLDEAMGYHEATEEEVNRDVEITRLSKMGPENLSQTAKRAIATLYSLGKSVEEICEVAKLGGMEHLVRDFLALCIHLRKQPDVKLSSTINHWPDQPRENIYVNAVVGESVIGSCTVSEDK